MMRRLAAFLAVLAALLWSGVVWGGYLLLAGAGAFVSQNAGAIGLPAEAAELAAWAQLLFDSFGQGAAVALWLAGLVVIGLAFLVFRAVAGRFAPRPAPISNERLPQAEAARPAPVQPATPAWGRNAARR